MVLAAALANVVADAHPKDTSFPADFDRLVEDAQDAETVWLNVVAPPWPDAGHGLNAQDILRHTANGPVDGAVGAANLL